MDEGSKPCITEESIPHLQDHVYIDLEKGFLKKGSFRTKVAISCFLPNRTRQSLLIPPFHCQWHEKGGAVICTSLVSMQLKGSLGIPRVPCPLPVSIRIPARTSTAGKLNYHILLD